MSLYSLARGSTIHDCQNEIVCGLLLLLKVSMNKQQSQSSTLLFYTFNVMFFDVVNIALLEPILKRLSARLLKSI
ncbi:hypothetical protein [Spirosoma flavum]|uniref:Uncharacterized protein n=1 Tax=Spirosoma flavum TaxID=2048557 RepID=A0ABW6AV85_9BACT